MHFISFRKTSTQLNALTSCQRPQQSEGPSSQNLSEGGHHHIGHWNNHWQRSTTAMQRQNPDTFTAEDQGGNAVAHERPPSICRPCWDGVFSAQYGLFGKPLLRTGTEEPPRGGYSYKSKWEELQAQAISGCSWCQFILRVKTQDSESAASPFTIIVGIRPENGYLGSPKDTQVLCIFINGFPIFEGYLYADADDPAAEFITARSRIVDVGSVQALALAKHHLEDCIQTHDQCSPSVHPSPLLPTRVVDCTDPSHPRLMVTDGLRGSYVALSYVWGEAQPHSTTISKVNTYSDGISPEQLPQTILDAIHTTNALGLQYLWVDSLCIIQDSEEDKLHEIARMGQIYRNTYVTIIAASAPRVSAGFLEVRPTVPPADFPPDIDIPLICSFSSDIKGREQTRVGKVHISPISVYNDSDTYDHWWDYFPEMEPVHDRAWCMQEYAMSPRAFVFASHTVQFHCRTGGIQNVGGSYNDHPDRNNLLPESFFKQEVFAPLVPRSSSWKPVRHAWYDAVADYTRRSLTKSEDKLVAFGGIAEAFQRIFGCDYLAGHWRDTLLADLLWQKYADTDMKRPNVYRAPSWSWAAVDGSVMPGRFDGGARLGDSTAEVLRCEVTLNHPQLPFGEVTSGVLILRAPAVRLHPDQGQEELDLELIGAVYLDSKDDQDVHDVWAVPLHRNEAEIEGIIVTVEQKGTPGVDRIVKHRRVGYFDSRGIGGSSSWVDTVQVVDIVIV
ncbi:hypothetical protein CVT26_002999 [Gymnopilus dilepis]|uniref:Heterokaryon incompatibility domain-containing protein n=1 Tax=Gymnopilus dilepis TaxID=231916 RepID=A0A409Y4J9_9AGAR|nr:hypothetical protein CVT26_002999 [Gymnopilus dilepis]